MFQGATYRIYICNAKNHIVLNKMSSNSIKTWLLSAAIACSITLHAQSKPNAEEGKKLYEANNCGSCHALDKKVVGPALRGVKPAVRTNGWLNGSVTTNNLERLTKILMRSPFIMISVERP